MTNYEIYKSISQGDHNQYISQIGALIVDEANLKLAYADLLISAFKKLSESHSDLKLIILCNSINTDQYKNFFTALDNQIQTIRIT